MKKIAQIFTFVLLFFATSSMVFAGSPDKNLTDANGLKQGYWQITSDMKPASNFPRGSIIEEGQYIDNKKTGVWKKFNDSGKVKSTITFKNNKPYGDYIIYYADGSIEEKGTWSRNKNTGAFERYHPNGQISQKFTFNDSGFRDGMQLYYHENGNLEMEVAISNGKEDGILRRFYENGNIKEEMMLNNGVLDKTTVVEYEKTEELMPVLASKEEAPKKSKNNSNKFKPNGYNKVFNDALQLTKDGKFKNGKLFTGKSFKYDENGLLLRVEHFQHGKFTGDLAIDEE